MSEGKRFRPKSLSRASVEAPMEAHWRTLPEEDARLLHARAHAEHARWNPFGARNRRRFTRYVVGTSIGFGVLGWFFLSASTRTFLVFVGVGLPLGALVALWRPTDFATGGLYALAAFLAAHLAGKHMLLCLLAGLISACIGVALGRVEEFKRLDMED